MNQYEQKAGELIIEAIETHLSRRQCKAVFITLRDIAKVRGTSVSLDQINDSEALEGFRKDVSRMLGKTFSFDVTDEHSLFTDLLELEKDIEILERNFQQQREAVFTYLASPEVPQEIVDKCKEAFKEFCE